MSNISSTGTLHGVIYRGVGGASSYGELTGKPKINNVTIDGNKTGHDYNLANLSDIPVVPPSPPSYAINVHHDDYYTEDLNWIMSNDIHKQWKVYSQPFGHCTAGNAGVRGLVPQPQAGWENRILNAGSGWISPPIGLKDYSTSEVDTGQKWIDGKTIYQRVFDLSNVIFTDKQWSNLILGTTNIEIIDVNGWFTINNDPTKFNFSYYRNGTEFFTFMIDGSDIDVRPNMNATVHGNIVIIYYTKNS